MKNKIDIAFGERVKIAMKLADTSVLDLAKALGVTRPAIYKWRNGNGMLAVNLFDFSDELNVMPRWVATGEGPMLPPATHRASEEALEVGALLANAWDKSLTEREKQLILALLDDTNKK